MYNFVNILHAKLTRNKKKIMIQHCLSPLTVKLLAIIKPLLPQSWKTAISAELITSYLYQTVKQP